MFTNANADPVFYRDSHDGVLILSTIHCRIVVITVIAGLRVYRDSVRHHDRLMFGLQD